MPPDRPSAADLDVDARFLLANERTLLAWTRTSLTLMAGGVGLAALAEGVPGRRVLAALLVVVGVAAQAAGAVRHRSADRALRRGDLPVVGTAPALLSVAVALVGALVAAGLLREGV